MKLVLATFALIALSGCGQNVSEELEERAEIAARIGEVATSIESCKSASMTEPTDTSGVPTGRSPYDICLARIANQTTPADAEICRAASGEILTEDHDTLKKGSCILLIA